MVRRFAEGWVYDRVDRSRRGWPVHSLALTFYPGDVGRVLHEPICFVDGFPDVGICRVCIGLLFLLVLSRQRSGPAVVCRSGSGLPAGKCLERQVPGETLARISETAEVCLAVGPCGSKRGIPLSPMATVPITAVGFCWPMGRILTARHVLEENVSDDHSGTGSHLGRRESFSGGA